MDGLLIDIIEYFLFVSKVLLAIKLFTNLKLNWFRTLFPLALTLILIGIHQSIS